MYDNFKRVISRVSGTSAVEMPKFYCWIESRRRFSKIRVLKEWKICPAMFHSVLCPSVEAVDELLFTFQPVEEVG